MTESMAAKHAANKRLKDVIFGASAACREATEKYGADKVTNATIGAMMDEDGKLAILPTMERIYRSLPMEDIIAYAPISGLADYLDAVIDLTFRSHRPAGYMASVATAGGTGAIHHAIANYAEKGEYVLTSDWYWGTYNVICQEKAVKLDTFKLFDENLAFNIKNFADKVAKLLEAQESLLVIINSPAHNPTGYSLSSEDWDAVLSCLKEHTAKGKRITLLVDIAYLDYAGETEEVREFMEKFGNLPDNFLTLFSFSMSKGYTFYGQRTGALIAVSSSKVVIDEFKEVAKYSSRATWSNINRGAMTLLLALQRDKEALKSFEKERNNLYHLIQKRGNLFMEEAAGCGLKALPYKGGFFLSVPTADSAAVCERLHEDLIYAVPLKLGVRIAACSVSLVKMQGVAAKVKRAMEQ